MKVIAEMCRAH